MIKKLLTKSRALFSVGVLAAILTIVAAAVILAPGKAEKGHWGSLWGAAESIAAKDLPPEAAAKLALIKAGGPFEHRGDGVTFRNREKKLPIKRRGYYRVYVVPTPGAKGLGPRRIVAGCDDAGKPEKCEFWYTPDDYGTLRRIRE